MLINQALISTVTLFKTVEPSRTVGLNRFPMGLTKASLRVIGNPVD